MKVPRGSKLKGELNMFSEVKPKECQVEAAHEVATEWYSGYRLVWPKVDGSRNTTPWQPCAPPQPQHSLGFTLLIFILPKCAV